MENVYPSTRGDGIDSLQKDEYIFSNVPEVCEVKK